MDTITNNETASNLHTFKAYDSQLSIPVKDGERVVKCLYKTNMKTGKIAGENAYIVVPEKHLDESVVIENAAMLAPYISLYLQSVEDAIIKEHHKNGGQGFSDSFLSLAKVLEKLDAEGQSSRLNKEKIEHWFDSTLQDSLIAMFADKLGVTANPTDAEMDKLAAVCGAYKAKFASLASGKTYYKKEEAQALQIALEKVPGSLDTSIGARFHARLEAMKAKPEANELLLAL